MLLECPECHSHDIASEYLWPRENLTDKSCECLECGCLFDVIQNTVVIEKAGA